MAKRKDLLLAWIEASIRYGGMFGPQEKIAYQQALGVSEPSVSRHQAEFVDRFEEACGNRQVFRRDQTGRVLGGKLSLTDEAILPETPVFPDMPDLERWLQDTLGGSGYFDEDIRRQIPKPSILRRVVQAIRHRSPLDIRYHSRSGEKSRSVSPHALVKIVGRIHMRAYDHATNEYRDFVLSRITDANSVLEGLTYVGSEHDNSWNKFQNVLIKKKNNLDDQNEISGVHLDFGLSSDGHRVIIKRSALINYLIDNLQEGFESPISVSVLKKNQPL